MRIGSFNVENLFSRAKAMNLDTWTEGKTILDQYSRVTTILQKEVYSAGDKAAIIAALPTLGLDRADESEFVLLRQNRGRLLRRPAGSPPIVVANGRADWIGWLELKTEAVDEIATRMTAKVIKEVNADVLAVVEAENRIALTRFANQLLKPLEASYSSIMLIDGNDERGIDVGLLTRRGYQIESIISHVDDMEGESRLFSRDCPEFTIRTDEGAKLLVLVNHFKSKGYGTPAVSNARRKAQARRVRAIYDERRSQGSDLIAIVGDLNDTPNSDPLSPLFGNGSDLRDISTHPRFAGDGRPGTYGTGSASNQIDFLLLSPALYERVTAGSVLRKGVWGGTHGTLFEHYSEMTSPVHAASDHAALWADIDL